MAGQQAGLAPFMGRLFNAFPRLPFFSQTARGEQKRVIPATELYRIRSVRGSLHSLVVCTCVLMLASAFLPFAACVAGRHANSLQSKISSSLQAPARFPLSPLSAAGVSHLQAHSQAGDGVSAAPPLGLKEHNECLYHDSVQENTTDPPKEKFVLADDWAEHIQNRAVRRGSLSAYQTTHRPGNGRQFGISFPIPENLAKRGEAFLLLAKKWDGHEHNWECPEHELEVLELEDNVYLQGSQGVKETGNRLSWKLPDDSRHSKMDVTSLVYGRNMAGRHLHLLVREKTYGCLSQFDNIDEEAPPSIVLTVNGDEAVDAKYGEWQDIGRCRLQCKSSENFKCQKRSCWPGKNGGEPCVRDQLTRKVLCAEDGKPCTCEDLQNACPEKSVCVENEEDGAECK